MTASRRWLMLLAMAATGRPAAVAGGLSAQVEAALAAAAPDVARYARADAPFLVSSDGGQLLIKNERGTGRSELILEDLASRKVEGSYRGEWPLLIAWRPHAPWLSFVEEDRRGSGYRLKLWSYVDGRVLIPDVPPLALANRLMHWSPDGRYLALLRPGGDRDELRLWDAGAPAAPSRLLLAAPGISDYEWSPDGSLLAVAAADDPGAVRLYGRPGGASFRRVPARPSALLRQLAWLPGGRSLLLTRREPGRPYYALARLDLASGACVGLAAPGSNVELPAGGALGDGRYVYAYDDAGLKRLMLGGEGGPDRAFGFATGSAALLALDEAHGCAWVSHRGEAQPGQLYRVGLQPGSRPVLAYGGLDSGFVAPPPRRIVISVPGGPALPIYVWRGSGGPARGIVIQCPYIRTTPISVAFDPIRQYLLQKGCGYAMFDFPPTTDTGKDWSLRVGDSDVAAGLAVVDYVRRELGVPADRVVLFGLSNGTEYAVRMAERMPDKRGGLLLRSSVGWLSPQPIPGHHFRVVGLHGEFDPFPALQAKAAIEKIFGAGFLEGPDGAWGIMRGESHSPVFIQSKIQVAAALMALAQGP